MQTYYLTMCREHGTVQEEAVLKSDHIAAMKEKDEMLIAERAVSQCLREDFNEVRKQIAALEAEEGGGE
jgi:polyhydroxyalkanoate synthesis regulator phasin